MALTPLTTRARVENRLSAVATALHTDHNPQAAIDEAIDAATADVAFYLASRFTAAEMEGNQWVTSVATHRAVMWVCTWRNNPLPKWMQDQWAEYVEMMEGLAVGKYQLPGLGIGTQRAPVLVHPRVDYRRRPSIRITREGTSPRAHGQADYPDRTEPLDD